MPARIQSPSSINTYKQCPRKYYYQYIEKLETRGNIHTVRGGIVHKVMEEFFKLNDLPDTGYALRFQLEMLTLLKKHWDANILELSQFAEPHELDFYLHESQLMVVNWANLFSKRLDKEMKKGLSAFDAFRKLTPTAEQEIISESYKVRGFIDAIETGENGAIRIMDYKTSKHAEISEAYRLQLAIYALLFRGKAWSKTIAGRNLFPNESERLLEVNDELLKLAKMEIDNIHAATIPEDKHAYPMKPTRLCKWGTGQCDFFEQCYGKEKADERYRQTLLSVRIKN